MSGIRWSSLWYPAFLSHLFVQPLFAPGVGAWAVAVGRRRC